MSNVISDKKIKNSRISVRPFVYNIPSISAVSIRFIILLMIQIIMLAITKSYSALIVIASCTLAALFSAAINQFINKEPVYNIINIILPGIIIGMLLPESYPPMIAFIITTLTIFISRSIVFKGVNCWLNVSTLAIIIAWYIGRQYFPTYLVNSGNINLRNTSVYLIENGTFPTYSFDPSVTAFLNKYIFSIFNVNVPEGFISLMWDTHSVIPAFRFNIITILSSIVIFSDNSFSLIIPTLFVTVYATFVRLFGPFLFGGYFNQGDIILAIMTSGILFCATYLIQWYGTSPITIGGKFILGAVSGALAFAIIGVGTSPIGMIFTVLCTNICCIIIRIFEEKNNEIAVSKVIEKLSAKAKMEE